MSNVAGPTPKWMRIAGWVVSALPVLMMGVGGVFAALQPDQMRKGTAELGFPEKVIPVLVTLEIAAAVLYAIPQTAVLGAILLTGYLGGAIACHVRVWESKWVVGAVVGVLVWLGLYLRDARVRALLPLRSV